MYKVDQCLDVVDRGVRDDAVTQVKYVAWPSINAIEHFTRLSIHAGAIRT